MSFRLVVEGNSTMRYRIVQREDFRVAGRKARVPLVHEGMNPAIVAFIRGLGQDTRDRIADLAARSAGEPAGVVGVSVNLAEDRAEGTELDYWYGAVTGAHVAPDPDVFDVLDVPAGTWAVFDSSGPFPQTVQYLWRDVFTQWFPSNPYRSRPGPEILGTRLSADGTHADTTLWIPVERSR
jgi:AraC family transcriptional regulator